MNREELHQVVDQAERSWQIKALMHALIDLGRITDFVCQAERCIRPSREIDMTAITTMQTRPKDAPQIDHIVPQVQGGSDRVENLRLVHYVCNVSRAFYKGTRDGSASAATRKAENLPVTCNVCESTYKGLAGLRAHIRQAQCGGTIEKIECSRCGMEFVSYLKKKRHTHRACRMRQDFLRNRVDMESARA